ncbi:MAG: ABC transporter ATP-binding protein [Pseudomonadota bacterium]
MGEAALLDAQGLTRRFGSFTAVDTVDLSIAPGQRLALLGENGAGKSTFVKMLYGLLAPSAGEIRWRGAPVVISDPAMARRLGIGLVFQHFSVFDALSVAENIALAIPGLSLRSVRAQVAAISAEYGLVIEPDRAVHSLSAGEKQRVEVIRCLMQSPHLLIMDEPTSVLTPQEVESLFATLNRLSAEGVAILYITHKLAEVSTLCDSATVLRQGRVVARLDPRSAPPSEMAAAMVGEQVEALPRRSAKAGGETKLRVAGLSLPAVPPFGRALDRIELSVRGGEILGIAGVAGEGQSELMAALIGERLAPDPSMVEINGRSMGRLGPTARRLAGAGYVPEDRNGHAAVGEMDLPDNILLSHHRAADLARRGWVRLSGARDWAERVRARFDVRAGHAKPRAGGLSGGNLQKFVVGREILREPAVLVVSQPTWGVDPGAARVIREALLALAGAGSAVLVISQDLEELMGLADRIAVMRAGRLSTAEPVAALDAKRLGLMMGAAA